MAKEEKKIWIFHSKKEMIISSILFVIFLIGFIVLGTGEYDVDKKQTSNVKDISEYKNVPASNVFKTINASEARSLIKTDDVIMLFGASNNEWVGKYASIINSVAKEVGVKAIYYYNLTDDRAENNGSYEAVVEYLSTELYAVEGSDLEIYAPLLVVKKDGVFTCFDEETGIHKNGISASDYWNNYNTNEAKETLRVIFTDFLKEDE